MARPSPAVPRHQLDVAVHQLWRRRPEALLRLTLGPVRLRRVLSERISSVRREADGAALAEGPDGPFVAHLEFHTDSSPQRVARQMYVTGAALYARHGGRYPVVGTAVLLDRRSRMDGRFHLQYGSTSLVEVHFRVVRLYELPAAELASVPDLAPLCALGAGATLQDVARAGEVIREAGANRADTVEALGILYVVSGRRFDARSLARLPWRTEAMQSSTFMEAFNMGLQSGEANGLLNGERRALRRVLGRRFGALPKWADAKIEAAGQEQVEAWLDASADATSLEAILGPPPRRSAARGRQQTLGDQRG